MGVGLPSSVERHRHLCPLAIRLYRDKRLFTSFVCCLCWGVCGIGSFVVEIQVLLDFRSYS